MSNRVAVSVALAVVLAGCTTAATLRTISGPRALSAGDVWVVSGLLVSDAESGTAIRVERKGQTVPGLSVDGRLEYGDTDSYLRPVDDEDIVAITWPEGYTARRSVLGGEVDVLNPTGEVVARTGFRYVCANHVDGSWGACEAESE